MTRVLLVNLTALLISLSDSVENNVSDSNMKYFLGQTNVILLNCCDSMYALNSLIILLYICTLALFPSNKEFSCTCNLCCMTATAYRMSVLWHWDVALWQWWWGIGWRGYTFIGIKQWHRQNIFQVLVH